MSVDLHDRPSLATLEARPTGTAALAVRDLVVGLERPAARRGAAGRDSEPVPIVRGVSLDVPAGSVVGLVGESGSGKTLTALAVAGLLPAGVEVWSGGVDVVGRDVRALAPRDRRAHLAAHVGVVFQNPTPALNPRLRIGRQVAEALPAGTPRRAAREQVAQLLRDVGIDDVAKTAHAFPHELSGGLNQRVVIAMALARSPRLLIADEPTTALDVSVQAQVLDLLDDLRERHGLGVLLVSHDIGVIADRTHHVHVMSQGVVVESGPTRDVLERPQHEYTQRLLAAVPSRLERARVTPRASSPAADEVAPQLVVRDLRRAFALRGAHGRTRHVALDGVDLTIRQGAALGLVGESGSGKTTLARIVVGLERADSGTVEHDGLDATRLDRAQRRAWRRDVQYVFQDPYGSLDPRLTVAQTLREPLELTLGLSRREAERQVADLLDEVELPRAFAQRLPGELSGGQRQRVGIARALATRPRLVVADEPVSALDLSVQARILRLLERLRAERGLTYLFISHDLGVGRFLCDDVVVLRAGRIVEQGRTRDVLDDPQHPYTRALVAAVPGQGTA
ncbi:dipeptide ABC transporter ATP-binding protein [Cellulomonas palmilytica]|uniref:dipeptide ABC transporter ATP-binding protein n=1 Tax=Cellulomonas palmilytica TaxID=2608402 RepID=UPI001F16851E|nr:ABC transporter ATP-binding protein [Cellulomonas palmilytica]UJP39461.1 ABC transporter ATP-binding protein [Cellulomonas palmilytica]